MLGEECQESNVETAGVRALEEIVSVAKVVKENEVMRSSAKMPHVHIGTPSRLQKIPQKLN